MLDHSANMKHVANVLMCPHQWGASRNVRVVDPDGKAKPYDGKHRVCSLCCTNRVDREDGTSSMYPASGLSDTKPT